MTPQRVLICGALLMIGLTACGDTDTTSATNATPPSGKTLVDVVATDLAFDAKTYDTTAGAVTIHYRNDGAIPHTLVIEDIDGFKLDVPRKAATDQGTTDLEAGDYVLFCDVPGHREAGMEATLRVT
jgi:plastocyanin